MNSRTRSAIGILTVFGLCSSIYFWGTDLASILQNKPSLHYGYANHDMILSPELVPSGVNNVARVHLIQIENSNKEMAKGIEIHLEGISSDALIQAPTSHQVKQIGDNSTVILLNLVFSDGTTDVSIIESPEDLHESSISKDAVRIQAIAWKDGISVDDPKLSEFLNSEKGEDKARALADWYESILQMKRNMRGSTNPGIGF